MRAQAAIVAGTDGCRVLRCEPPLTFRETVDGLAWVGSAAGPVGGDELALDVDVDDDAALSVWSVAASLVHPGPDGRASSLRVGVRVGDGADLSWQPQPTVLVRGCDHHVDTAVDLATGASLVWREEVVLGRHGEATGSLRQRLTVDVAGAPLVRTELAIGPRWPGSLGPAGAAGARAVGTVLIVGPASGVVPARPARRNYAEAGVRLAIQPLTAGATLVTALGERAGAVTAALDQLVGGSYTRSGGGNPHDVPSTCTTSSSHGSR